MHTLASHGCIAPSLTPYYLTRLECSSCGTFTTGTADRPDPAAGCPWCDQPLLTLAQCRGATSRALPFTSDPHTQPAPDTPIDVINQQVSDKQRRRNTGHGKSTGRPRGGNGRSIYRDENEHHDPDADHKRHARNKAELQSTPASAFP